MSDSKMLRRMLLAVASASCVVAFGDALDLLLPEPQRVVRAEGVCGGEAVSVVRAVVPESPAAVADQAYILKIGQSIEIIAGGNAGKRYAQATLALLQKLSGGKLPACTITDWPTLKWRGYMNDCGRNYLDTDAVKAILDVMAAYKMNLFHWHLSDNHGWRLESKKYPQLNRTEAFARQKGKFYTQDEFREIIRYAAERGITVMPELDVPGHSAAFRRGMGRSAMSEPGTKKIVAELFEELCSLADAKTMPFVHIGTDEVHKSEEKVDVSWPSVWAGTVNAADRAAVVWRPGLPVDPSRRVIDMIWNDRPKDLAGQRNPFFCAARLYNAEWTPFEVLPRAAFTKPCRWNAPEGRCLGAITCTWHDANVGEDVRQLFKECMVFPSIVAMADNFWHGAAKDDLKSAAVMPSLGTSEFAAAEVLERRMLAQRDMVLKDFPHPFPFFAQAQMRWRVRDCETGEVLRRDVASGTIWLKTDPECTFRNGSAVAPGAKGPVVAEAWVKSPREMECGAWIDLSGMDGLYARLRMPSRPKDGRWNRYNARVELNGEVLPPPKWRNPGTNDVVVTGAWGTPELEVPLVDEMPGLREPYPIRLKRGWNHICITTAVGHGKWDLSVVSFALFNGTATHPREVEGLEWRSDSPDEAKGGASSQGMTVGWATAAEKVRPRTADKMRPIPADGLKVRLARNEYESVQVLVSQKAAGLKGVKVSVDGDLRGDAGVFSATNITSEVMGYVNVRVPSSYHAGYVVPANNAAGYSRKTRPLDAADGGWWPDPILRFLDSADVKAGDVQSFWVRVHCPEHQAAGTYRGTLVASAEGVPGVRIPFSVRVNGFAIGRTPPMPIMVSFNPGFGKGTANKKTRDAKRADPESPQNIWKRRKTEWCDFLADYFITMNQLYGANVSWDVMERLRLQERLGVFNLGYWGHPESTNAQDVAEWRERTISRLIENWQEAKRRNLAGHAILYGCDEAHAKDFAVVGLAARELKAALPEVPLVSTAMDKRYGVDSPLDAVDWFVPGIQSKYYNPVRAEASRAQGRRVGWYGDPDAPYANLLVETAAIDFRLLMGAMAVRMKPDGYLYYATANWGANKCIEEGPFTKWNPRSYTTLNGNGSWVCCGPDGMPLATIRLENFRDGLEDLWYAKILEGSLAERCDRDDEWSRKARELLAVPHAVMDTMTNFTDDPAVLYRWRDALADLIEENSNSRKQVRPAFYCLKTTKQENANKEMNRRNFLGGLLMVSAALPLRSFSADEVVEGKGATKSLRKNPILSYAQFEVGAEKPFSILHISDTHLTEAYPGENPLRLKTSESRTKAFGGGQEEALRVSLEWARSTTDYVLHTGDLIDFQSDANLDLVRKYFGTDVKMFGSLGNHEHYTRRPDLKGEKAKTTSREALASAYPFDLSFSSNIINGVNFVALDNSFGKVTAEQSERFDVEVAKGLPIILCCHVPFYTDCIARVWARYWRNRGKKFRSAGVPAPRDDRKSQLEDSLTQEFVAKLKAQPLLRGILAGHLHVAVSDRFSPTAVEHVVGANFDYSACEVLVT